MSSTDPDKTKILAFLQDQLYEWFPTPTREPIFYGPDKPAPPQDKEHPEACCCFCGSNYWTYDYPVFPCGECGMADDRMFEGDKITATWNHPQLMDGFSWDNILSEVRRLTKYWTIRAALIKYFNGKS